MKNKYFVDSDIRDFVLKIFIQIYQDKFSPDIIYGFARGGLIPGIYLSHILGIPFVAINKDCQFNHNKLDYKNALVIDDINDTGSTLSDFAGRYNNLFDIVRYATVVNNTSSSFTVDYSGYDYNKHDEPDWIVFPWEMWWSNK